MTNEEKARKLAIEYCKDIDDEGRESYNIFCEEACLEMAKWKDEVYNGSLKWIADKAMKLGRSQMKRQILDIIFLKKYLLEYEVDDTKDLMEKIFNDLDNEIGNL